MSPGCSEDVLTVLVLAGAGLVFLAASAFVVQGLVLVTTSNSEHVRQRPQAASTGTTHVETATPVTTPCGDSVLQTCSEGPGAPLHIALAPMVDGSELAFRLLCRKHGATSAYTPMLRPQEVLETFRRTTRAQRVHPQDRPLVVQLCGHDPEALGDAVAALMRHHGPDGVDLNLGCPQEIAAKEGIGAFLAEGAPDTAVACVYVPRAIPLFAPHWHTCLDMRAMSPRPAPLLWHPPS